jgi:hypothetical protein
MHAMCDEEITGHKELWAHVLGLAVKDAKGGIHKVESEQWIASNSEDPATFRWVCRMLEIDPDWARREIAAGNCFKKKPKTKKNNNKDEL